MPRSTYYQNAGNPVQHRQLPDEPTTLQFAHTSSDPVGDGEFARIVLRNLFLLSGICLAADWLGHSFPIRFPFNLLVMVLAINGMIRLWQATTVYRPSVFLIAVPVLLHFIGVPLAVRAMLTTTLAGYAGREFARHYVYLVTTHPIKPSNAALVRETWDAFTVVAALIVMPVGLVLVAPKAIGFLLMIVIAYVTIVVFMADPVSLPGRMVAAWCSWCTYNRHDESAPGILKSPAGSLVIRLGLTVLLVTNLTMLLTSVFPMSEIVWGDGVELFGPSNLILGMILTFALVGLPVILAMGLMVLVSLPAISALGRSEQSNSASADWQDVTKSIQNSPNSIERESIYLGRLAHDGSPLLVPRTIFREHAHILGDSGSGKTARGLIPLAEQLVSNGQCSLMVIDLKGDSQEILASLCACARRTSESSIPVRYFSVREDQATFAFNPFQLPCWQKLNLFQRTDVLCGALGLIYGTDYGRGFYSSANAAVLHATLRAFPDLGSFTELSDRIAYVTSRSKTHGLNDGQSDAGNHVRMVAERLASFKALNVTPQHTPNEQVAQLALDPTRLFSNQEIFYFHLSTTLGPGSSPEIARLAMFMLLTTATLTSQRRQVYLLIDEFQRVAAHNVDAILQIARSMNVGVVLANQSMLDLKRDDLVHVVEANCRFRQWFAISSPEEQERLSKASGQTVDVLHSESVSQQRDGFEVRSSTSSSASQFIAPRLSVNDIKLASDDPRKSIALVTRGAGYCQYGGMPVVVESDFHISESEFLARKNAPWPSNEAGSFVPAAWQPVSERPQKIRAKRGPKVTEEVIGDEKDPFGRFLADHPT